MNLTANLNTLFFLLSLVLTYFFIKWFFRMGMFTALGWWWKHFSEIHEKPRRLFFAVLVFLAFAWGLGRLLYWLTVPFVFDSETYVYLGHSGSLQVYSAAPLRPGQVAVEAFTLDVAGRNFTFNGIYRSIPFFEDANGVPEYWVKPFDIFDLLTRLSMVVLLACLCLLGFYGLYEPVIKNQEERFKGFSKRCYGSFEAVAGRLGIHELLFKAFVFLSVVGVIGFYMHENRIIVDDPEQTNPDLPREIREGFVLPGRIMDIEEETSDSKPTGKWTVVYRVGGVFSPEVFISQAFDEREHPDWAPYLQLRSNRRESVDLRVTESLGVEPVLEGATQP